MTVWAFAIVLFVAGDRTYASDFIERKDLYAEFDSAGVIGSMVVLDVAADEVVTHLLCLPRYKKMEAKLASIFIY